MIQVTKTTGRDQRETYRWRGRFRSVIFLAARRWKTEHGHTFRELVFPLRTLIPWASVRPLIILVSSTTIPCRSDMPTVILTHCFYKKTLLSSWPDSRRCLGSDSDGAPHEIRVIFREQQQGVVNSVPIGVPMAFLY